tara:strand:- start:509 stop:748 length:240 start_codon:yes stop_codon:yes gene_type:complete
MEKISDERTMEWKEQMKDTEEKIREHEKLIAYLQQKLEKLLEANAYKDDVVVLIKDNETELAHLQQKLKEIRFRLSQIE